jgi:hypothetical protein
MAPPNSSICLHPYHHSLSDYVFRCRQAIVPLLLTTEVDLVPLVPDHLVNRENQMSFMSFIL